MPIIAPDSAPEDQPQFRLAEGFESLPNAGTLLQSVGEMIADATAYLSALPQSDPGPTLLKFCLSLLTRSWLAAKENAVFDGKKDMAQAAGVEWKNFETILPLGIHAKRYSAPKARPDGRYEIAPFPVHIWEVAWWQDAEASIANARKALKDEPVEFQTLMNLGPEEIRRRIRKAEAQNKFGDARPALSEIQAFSENQKMADAQGGTTSSNHLVGGGPPSEIQKTQLAATDSLELKSVAVSTEAALDWLQKIDADGELKKPGAGLFANEWFKLCQKDPAFVLGDLRSALMRRRARQTVKYPIAWMAAKARAQGKFDSNHSATMQRHKPHDVTRLDLHVRSPDSGPVPFEPGDESAD